MFRKILAAAAALALGAGLTVIAVTPATAASTAADCAESTQYRWQAATADAAAEPEFWPSADGFSADVPPAGIEWGQPVATQTTPAQWQSDDASADCYVAPEQAAETTDPASDPETDETVEEDAPIAAMRVAPAGFAAAAAAVTVQQCAAMNAPTYVSTTAGMTFDNRTGGSHAMTPAGLAITWVGPDLSQAKAAGYVTVAIPFEEVGTPALDYALTSGASAGLNLTLFKNGAYWGNLVLEPLFTGYWINKAVPGMPAGPNPGYQLAYGTLDDFLAAFVANGWDVDVVAVGYSGGSGSVGQGVVRSLTAGCDTWIFGSTPPPTNQTCAAYTSTVVTDLAQLDLSSTRSDGHQALVAGGLHVWTGTAVGAPDPRKAAGYLDVPDFPLTQTGTLALGWTGGTAPGGQLVVDLDNDGIPDGILVFEPASYGQNVWLASIRPGFSTVGAPTVGGGGGPINGSINQYLANWPNAKALAIGYSLGSGITSDGKLTLLQAGCIQVTFVLPAPTNQTCAAFTSIVVTDLTQLDLTSTRSDGHNELVTGALRVWTGTTVGAPDPRKAAGYLDVPDFPLSQTGTVALTWTGTALPPGGQIVVDLDNNGTPDGILVFEPSFYGQNLWLANIAPGFMTFGAPTVGGGGGPINGTIDQYLANWPNAKALALGYSLGSGVTGDGTISLIQAGCLQVTFDKPVSLPTLPLPGAGGGAGGLGTLAVTGADTSRGFTLGVGLVALGLLLAGAAFAAGRRPRSA